MNRLGTGALCLVGMAAGLWIDTRAAPLDVLASWCGDPGSLWRAATRHWMVMPASHLLMAAAALLPPGRLAWRTACAVAMVFAMTAAGLLAPALARAAGWSAAEALLVTMGVGMAAAAGLLPRACPGQAPAARVLSN